MTLRYRTLLALVIALAPSASHAVASDWPQFQGPDRNGHSSETDLRLDWQESAPPELWSLAIGPGFGGVAVAGEEVFFLDREFGEADMFRVLDRDTGEELWSHRYEAEGRLSFNGSRCVPSVEEAFVYTLGGFGHVVCYDREFQEPAWSLHLAEDLDGEIPMFGWCQAPLVIEDLLVLTPLGEEVGLVALDRFTSDEMWRTEALGTSHSTPMLTELDGVPQLLFLHNLGDRQRGLIGYLSSFDPDSGELLWRIQTAVASLPIPQATRIDDQRVFVTTGYGAGSVMLRVTHEGGEWQAEELFRNPKGSQTHQPIRVDEHLYILVNENQNDPRTRQKEGGLMCLSLDGEVRWRTGNEPYFGRGNMLLADGLLWIQDGHSGVLRTVRPNPEKYDQVGETNVFDITDRRDKQMWAPMALSAGRLLLRSQDTLKCLDLRKDPTAHGE